MIALTDAAFSRLQEMIQEENNPDLKLRIAITGGGCSGFKYDFLFEDTPQADDTVIRTLLVVDPMSLMYLTGAKIDFEKTAEGEQFKISNPHAKTTCGCGASFTT